MNMFHDVEKSKNNSEVNTITSHIHWLEFGHIATLSYKDRLPNEVFILMTRHQQKSNAM